MMKFAVRHWVANNSSFDTREVDKLQKFADAERTAALTSLE
jgi:hypothetical protein